MLLLLFVSSSSAFPFGTTTEPYSSQAIDEIVANSCDELCKTTIAVCTLLVKCSIDAERRFSAIPLWMDGWMEAEQKQSFNKCDRPQLLR